MSENSDSDKPKTNRRDFLSGKSALDAARDKLPDVDSADKSFGGSSGLGINDRQSNYVELYSKNAMACEFELLFNMHQYSQSGAAAMSAFQLIDDLEDQMTVYRNHSEVSQLNLSAAKDWVQIEPRLYELLKLSSKINSETNRAFDITAGALSKVWGFDKRSGSLPEESAISDALGCVGMQNIEFEDASSSIRFRSADVSINLNGIGKGHALDRVAELFESKSIGDFIIHGGQSSVLARGSSSPEVQRSGDPAEQPNPDQAPGWEVGVSHPTLPGVRLGQYTLRSKSLGTSGTARQGFFHKGKRYGHIIDPRSGWPTGHVLSTTVVAKSAAVCDALATAFFVLPIEEVQAYCDSHDEVSAILVEANPKVKSKVELHCFNVAQEDWQLLV